MKVKNRGYKSNPPLPSDVFVPDGEARVFDNRLYVYGSMDKKGKKEYCSGEYHVFSTDDLIHWTDHGVSFSTEDVPWSHANLYAPDCVYRNGKYYLYFCQADETNGVAVSDTPYGPFKKASYMENMHGIDPAVLVDDDGKAYIYWGQFDHVRAAELNDDMRSIRQETVIQPLSVKEHEFHEGASIRKRGEWYYLVFTDTHRYGDRPCCLGYAMSKSPFGPFLYKGIIIDNFGCDPKTWNNHGSIFEFKGQWYVLYHRSTHKGEFSRRMCIEPIYFHQDGTISEVRMTSSLGEEPIHARTCIPADIACSLLGSVFIADQGEGMCLCNMKTGDSAVYRYLCFNDVNFVTIHADRNDIVFNILINGEKIAEVKSNQITPIDIPKNGSELTIQMKYSRFPVSVKDLEFQ